MAYDYLVDHALTNVWCTPDQDMQAVVKPARLTPSLGVFNKVDVLWRSHQLPVLKARFHVYQIGQLHPQLMGLFPVSQVWTPMSEACARMSLIVNIYNVAGVQLPRTEVWYMVTYDRNLIIAVKEQPKVPINLRTEDIFMRVYSNEYFNTMRADDATDVVYVQGATVRTTDEILALQTSYLSYKNRPVGHTQAFVNGFMVDQLDLITVKNGDVAEFVYDASVRRVQTYTVGDLLTFESTLDSKFKYLLHYAQSNSGVIDFHDDMDFYVTRPSSGGRYQGVYYHRNAEDAVRNVTHKDHSIVPAYVVSYASANGWADVEALKIHVFTRKSGYERPLVNEDNRVKELYKMSSEEVFAAMVGVDATVPNWKAEHLEASFYTQLMRARVTEVDLDLVENAYGYNAISKLLADTPQHVHDASGQKVIDVPYGLQARSTAYEYNADGALLGWAGHVQGAVYPARDIHCELVEMIAGDVSDRLDEHYGVETLILDPKANYRMYRCPMVAGVPNEQWEDVTDSAHYAISGGVLSWQLDPLEWYTCARSDRTSLGYTLELSMTDGVLDFSLVTRQLRFGVLGNHTMQIPMGELDLWLNGKSLIEGLDYLVKFPKIVVINKEYLVSPQSQTQRVDVRFSGFCNPDFSRDIPDDVGFVLYGQLSHNNRFDIRDDKVMRIVIGGQLYHRSELMFSEDNPAISVLDSKNGTPYMMRDLVVPMRGYTGQTTYEMREHSQEIDQRISDYLTLKNPMVKPAEPSAIGERYAVYSPFLSKVLRDVRAGVIDNDPLKLHYNDEYVLQVCQPYEWLLEFDPTQAATSLPEQFINIHPHHVPAVLDVDIYHYKFITRVAKLYTHDRVNLSHFLRIAAIS